MVSCPTDAYTPSIISTAESIPDLDAWPLDGSDPAPGSDKENPVMRCGPGDSYSFVASIYRCPDGHNPLDGDRNAGRTARRGNVGSNSHHNGIIDAYEVPCASGKQDVFVNMYGCPDGPSRQFTGKGLALRQGMPPAAKELTDVAFKLSDSGHLPEAIEAVKQALAIISSELGPQHPQNATLLDLLGVFHAMSDELPQAEKHWVAAYQLWQEAEWPPTPLVGNTLLGLATVYAPRKQPATVVCLTQRAITYLEDTKGPFNHRVVQSLLLLGAAYDEQGRTKLAENIYKRAVRLAEMGQGRRDPLTRKTTEKLKAFYAAHADLASVALLQKRIEGIP